jgi:hypothetical protein
MVDNIVKKKKKKKKIFFFFLGINSINIIQLKKTCNFLFNLFLFYTKYVQYDIICKTCKIKKKIVWSYDKKYVGEKKKSHHL